MDGGVNQTRMMSVAEALANVAVGYGVAVATQMVVLPFFGVMVSFSQNLSIGAVFTVVSIIRSYCLRRFFEGLRRSSK